MSIFSKVSMRKLKRSTFNMSYDRKFSLNMGDLVPMHVQEVVPGDSIQMTTQQMMRLAPMLSPVMHEVNVFTHFFYVPNRLSFDKWNDFITGGESGLESVILPTVEELVVEVGSLADYLGLPLSGGLPANVSLLPFIAYQMIYNEYYRDQNLIDPVDLKVEEGPNGANAELIKGLTTLRKRAWHHDYFTSALPWAQKGASVKLPLGKSAPIYYEASSELNHVYKADGTPLENAIQGLNIYNDGILVATKDGHNTAASLDNSKDLKVDLTEASGSTVNELRKAFRLQEWLEKNGRAGGRIVEMLMSHFGVKSSDARLQRPEYLGGGMSPVMISEVLQTSETSGSPQGNMSGHGLNLGKNHSFKRFFEEHGYVIGIVSVMPKTSYQQGIPRHFSKFDKFDYFWSDFEHIGEQPIYNKELFAEPDSDVEGIFGYTPRYSEYKYMPSTVHGDFKKTLDFWHMGRIFDTDNPPKLNKEFVESNPTKRIFAVEESEEATIYCHMFHNIKASRQMSYYSDPSFR